MTESSVMTIAGQAMILVAKLAGPVLVVSLVVGLAISLFQSVTQVQEFTLSFVPKLIAVALVILLTGHWMLGQLTAYTVQLYAEVPHLLSGG